MEPLDVKVTITDKEALSKVEIAQLHSYLAKNGWERKEDFGPGGYTALWLAPDGDQYIVPEKKLRDHHLRISEFIGYCSELQGATQLRVLFEMLAEENNA